MSVKLKKTVTVTDTRTKVVLGEQTSDYDIDIKRPLEWQRRVGIRYITTIKIAHGYQSVGVEIGVTDLPYPVDVDGVGRPSERSVKAGLEYAAGIVDAHLAEEAEGLDDFVKGLVKKYR